MSPHCSPVLASSRKQAEGVFVQCGRASIHGITAVKGEPRRLCCTGRVENSSGVVGSVASRRWDEAKLHGDVCCSDCFTC